MEERWIEIILKEERLKFKVDYVRFYIRELIAYSPDNPTNVEINRIEFVVHSSDLNRFCKTFFMFNQSVQFDCYNNRGFKYLMSVTGFSYPPSGNRMFGYVTTESLPPANLA